MADQVIVKAQTKRTKNDKLKILDFYVEEKQLKFLDALKDDNGLNPDSEAIKLFNDPFEEEKVFDLNHSIENP